MKFNAVLAWRIFIIAIVALVLLGVAVAVVNAGEAVKDSMWIKCRDVPDKFVSSGYSVLVCYRWNDWGDTDRVDSFVKIFKCPKGTRKRYATHPEKTKTHHYGDGIPDSLYCECWTVKTVCDTTYAKEE